jgi:hypothetical protein
MPLMHKFVEQSRIGIIRNECTRSSPIGPQTHVLGVFRTILLLHQLGANGPNGSY